MKIRVMGTADECKQAQDFYRRIGRQSNIRACSVSEPYPNRGSVGYYRVYVDIEYREGSDLYSDLFERDTDDITTFPACLDDMHQGGLT